MSVFGKKPATTGAFAPKSQQAEQPATTPAENLSAKPAVGTKPVGMFGGGAGAAKPQPSNEVIEQPAEQAGNTMHMPEERELTVLEILQGKKRPLGVSSEADRADPATDNPTIAFGAQAALNSPAAKAALENRNWTPQIQHWHSEWPNASTDERAVILKQQLDGLEQLASDHLEELTNNDANLPSLPTMAMLLRLTYARLAEHPAARDILQEGNARACALIARKMSYAKAGATARKTQARSDAKTATATETNKAAFGGFSL